MDFTTLLTGIMTNGIGAVCVAAVLWFAWLRETKTIPEMLRSFEVRNDKAIDTFASLIREERASRREEDIIHQMRHEENRILLEKIIAEIKEGRHLTLNLAHALRLRQAVEQEQAAEKEAAEKGART